MSGLVLCAWCIRAALGRDEVGNPTCGNAAHRIGAVALDPELTERVHAALEVEV